jgi:methylmalonyl-CoA mutase C-terminal domain/subunit
VVTDSKIRVLVAKPGLDGRMEVIYTGLRQTPEMVVNASLQEDVQVIGLSILSGAHNAIVPRVMDLLKQNKMDDVLVLVGGIIPDQDIEGLKKIGVAGIFQPGTPMDDIVKFIREHVKPHGVPAV